jgi:hypothetical protein
MAFGVTDASRRKCPRRRARIGPKNYRAEMCRDGARVGAGGSGARHAGSGVIATVTTSGYLFIAPEAGIYPKSDDAAEDHIAGSHAFGVSIRADSIPSCIGSEARSTPWKGSPIPGSRLPAARFGSE